MLSYRIVSLYLDVLLIARQCVTRCCLALESHVASIAVQSALGPFGVKTSKSTTFFRLFRLLAGTLLMLLLPACFALLLAYKCFVGRPATAKKLYVRIKSGGSTRKLGS